MANNKATTATGKWIGFFGGFHPILLHLPIGAVSLILLMEGTALFSGFRYRPNTTLALAFAAFTGVFATIFGYFLYLTGDCAGELIEAHKRDGIIFTILLIATFLIKYGSDITSKKTRAILKTGYIIGLAATTFMMILAGHHGGEITHGDPMDNAPWNTKSKASSNTRHRTGREMNPATNNATELATTPEKEQKTVQAATSPQPTYDPVVYTTIVAPIITEKCVKCHGDNKQKGGLRMDSYAALIKGGDYEKCLVPGDIAESTMITFLHLPLDDDLRMPPEGKPQLTEDEISILTWWVAEDAPEFKKLSEMNQSADVSKALKSVQK